MELIITIATSVITGGLTLIGVIFTSRKQHDITVQEIKTDLALMHQEIGQLEKKAGCTQWSYRKGISA